MSGKFERTETLRKALRLAVAAVKPIRERIRTTRDQERWWAWQEKRAGSGDRRHLHLALCYMYGTPYRKAEPKTCYDVSDVPAYVRKLWLDALIRDVAETLVQHGCIPKDTTEADVEKDVRAWIGGEATVLPTTTHPGQQHSAKLYVVVRADLPPGAQAAQAAHAMREFASEYPEIEREWHEKSNTLVILAVASEASLEFFLDQAKQHGVEASAFHEPDLNNSLTAVCLGVTGYRISGWLRNLPLALQEKERAA